ncbi:EamA family transporter [Nocardioides sp. MAHUQ-72]|uniref:EamA family transporter n=1 Tax=unclassified Nocardioides TaxID=2615069 RepID=UPI00361568A5
MPILLSLLAAVAYGLSDFVGGVTSKRVSPWTVALVAQLGGAALVLLLTLATPGSATGADLAWGVVAGLGNGFGTAFLYRGLSSGRMGVVAPVSGVGAAVVPVVVGVLAGERPGSLVWIGIVVALPGIWLVAREPATGPGPLGAGLTDGILAGLGFGSLFAALAQIPEEAGFLPLALNQVVAGATIVAVALALRAPWLPRDRRSLGGLVSGALGALATGSFLVATQGGYLTVTAVITSLYPAFTVMLAASLLRERVHRAQALGLGLCAVAVSLVAAG